MSASESEDDIDFGEDEEIEEDEAFNAEDQAKFGAWFGEDSDNEAVSDDEGGLTRGLESDDDGAAWSGDSEEDLDAADAWLEEQSDGASDGDEDGAGVSGEDASHTEMLQSMLGGHRRQRKNVVLNEPVAEGEFALGGSNEDGDLDVADLLAATTSSSVKAAQKQLAKLSAKGHALQAALPKRIKERQERKAAYEESGKEVSKWTPLVKANREVATLRFTTDKDIQQVTTAAGIASKHEATTDFEKEVAQLLKAAGHEDLRAVSEAEAALASKQMSAEELQKRQDAMAKQNALLFYQEQKARRLKKIKSKAYRRLMKKQRDKAAGLALSGQVDDPDQLREQEEEAEFERAKERLTLKHKNTSRWARRALKRGIQLADDSTKEALYEQLRLGQELKRKAASMRAAGSDESDASTEASDGEDGDGDGGSLKLNTREKAELAEYMRSGADGDLADVLPSKGLFAMPFMRRALHRQQQQVAVDALQLMEAAATVGQLPDGDAAGASAAGNGRRAFSGGAAPVLARGDGPGESSDDGGASDVDEDRQARRERLRSAAAAEARMDAAIASSEPVAATERPRRRAGGESGGAAVRGAAAVQPGQAPVQAAVPVQVIKVGRGTAGGRRGGAEEEAQAATRQHAPPELPSNDTLPAQKSAAPSSTTNEAAIMAAFAGDDVAQAFEADKEAQVRESVAHVEEPSALPGWGTWSNAKREPRWLTEQRAKAEAEKKQLLSARKDAKAKSVVISEKWDKKAAKYSTPSLPFPYNQKEVYERSMRVPLGREQNTEASFRELTRPAVIKQTGQIIAPLQKSKATLAASNAKRSRGDSVMVVAAGKVKRNRLH